MTDSGPARCKTATASKIIAEWPASRPFRVSAAIHEEAVVEISSTAKVELIYEEFCVREESGERPTRQEYLDRFPELESELNRLFAFHEAVDNALDSTWPSEGDRIDRFELERLIGCGAFSQVFLAKDSSLADRRCVLKLTRRLASEAALLGKLDHHSIVRVENVVSLPGKLTGLVMRYRQAVAIDRVVAPIKSVQWNSTGQQIIQTVIDRELLPSDGLAVAGKEGVPATLFWQQFVLDLCKSVSYCHSQKVVHGDLKPSNILVSADGDPLLIDFNLATDDSEYAEGGTQGYMAPEQLSAFSNDVSIPLNYSTDVFSLARVCLELLAGGVWLGHKAVDQEELANRNETLLQVVRAVHGEGWGRCLSQALTDNPDERLPDADALTRLVRRLVSKTRRKIFLRKRLLPTVVVASIVAAATATVIPTSEDRIEASWAALEQGDAGLAAAHLAKLDVEDVGDRDSQLLKGLFCLAAGDYYKAHELVELARQQRPSMLSVESLACCMIATGNSYEGAKGILAPLARGRSGNVRSKNNFAHLLILAADYEQAREHLEEATERMPNNAVLAHNLARVEFAQGLRESRGFDYAIFDRAIELMSDSFRPCWIKAQAKLIEFGESDREAKSLLLDAVRKGLYRPNLRLIRKKYPTLYAELEPELSEPTDNEVDHSVQQFVACVLFPSPNEVLLDRDLAETL